MKAVTIFSGVGSSSHALRCAGYDVIPHDIMPEACASLRANGFLNAVLGDVREVNWLHRDYDGVDALVGGPPCQPFSQAHSGDGEYDDRDMIPEFVRAVDELRPRLFIMEEVKTLTWSKHSGYLSRVLDDLERLGYQVDHQVLDASDYGVGQARKRLFIIGKANYTAPPAWPSKRDPKVTMAEALAWDRSTTIARNQLAPPPARLTSSEVAEGGLDWVHLRPAPTVVGSFRPDVAAKPGWRKPGDGPRQNTKGSVVTTLQERLILQALPADWKVEGSAAKRDLQVGNSVPATLVAELIEANMS